MILLPGGEFRFGNDVGRPDERPAHLVNLAPFRAAPDPVSNREYLHYVEHSDAERPPFLEVDDGRFAGLDQPVVGISWFEAVAYCDWLAQRSGLPLRLPSEAEREFAARGGLSDVDWPWGDSSPDESHALPAVATLDRPHAPAPECANTYGLRCMAENVHEWCSDWYDRRGYGPESPKPGVATRPTSRRASRGGSWRHAIKFTRVAARSSLDPGYHYNDYGFRVYADAT